MYFRHSELLGYQSAHLDFIFLGKDVMPRGNQSHFGSVREALRSGSVPLGESLATLVKLIAGAFNMHCKWMALVVMVPFLEPFRGANHFQLDSYMFAANVGEESR